MGKGFPGLKLGKAENQDLLKISQAQDAFVKTLAATNKRYVYRTYLVHLSLFPQEIHNTILR